jgi:CDP-diacylglycerol---serine O-phosphatidyltransferase
MSQAFDVDPQTNPAAGAPQNSSSNIPPNTPPQSPREIRRFRRVHRRRRLRRHGRRAYIRSVYFLPSMATLGNAVCGFAAIWVAAMADPLAGGTPQRDPWTAYLAHHGMAAAAYLILGAMAFDAIDGRLARFARHTTDFGGQLDSLADMISFGAAPAFVALRLFKIEGPDLPLFFSRLAWAMAAMYLCCAAIRLARFNVSNEHGEQHHFSFLGLPSPGAAGLIASIVLMQQELQRTNHGFLQFLSELCAGILPLLALAAGLLMISHLRYPHVVNRYLRGRRSIGRLILVLAIVLMLVAAHQYTLGIGSLTYAAWGPTAWLTSRLRKMRGRPTPNV